MMTIQCDNMEQFGDVVYQCVLHGLTFEAYATTLVVKLTGGY